MNARVPRPFSQSGLICKVDGSVFTRLANISIFFNLISTFLINFY